MSSRLAFWRELELALRADGNEAREGAEDQPRVFLAIVGESTAHSPGTAGASLFVDGRGEAHGTIGGGVMELQVIERAERVLGAGETVRELIDLHHRRDVEASQTRSGMICAGRQTNIYCTLGGAEDHGRILAWIRALENDAVEESPAAMALRLGSAGLQLVEAAGAESPRRRLERGAEWFFEDPALERRRLAILGGGHCAQALARLMTGVGWRVQIWDTRPEVLGLADTAPSLAGSSAWGQRLVGDFRQAADEVDHPELTPVIVMTTDMPNDVRALEGALRHPFPLIGAMGSEAKLEEIRHRLRGLGFGDGDLGRLIAPVGLEIGSRTPDEIAISVGAQLLAKRQEWL